MRATSTCAGSRQGKEGIRAAGGTPMEFNTVAVSDGITMGTEACAPRWSAARSSPTRSSWSPAATCSNGVIAMSGCGQDDPGTVMALARLNLPSLISTAARSRPVATRART